MVFAVALLSSLGFYLATGSRGAAGFLGLAGLAGLAGAIFRRKTGPGEVAFDERDRAIAEKAGFRGAMAAYGAVVLGCMGPWFICMFSREDKISVYYLPILVVFAMIALEGVRSATIILLYGREADRP